MINREMIHASLLIYSKEVDRYGQPRMTTPTEQSIEVTQPKLYQHTQVEDIRFQNVTDTCLTKDKTVTEENELRVGDDEYLIKFVNPYGRLCQLFLVKK